MTPLRRTGLLAVLATALLALVPVTPASAAPDGSWWYDALRVARNHQVADGRGTVIALLDGPVDTSAAELRGQHVEAGGTYCDHLPSPLLHGRDTFHGTSMAVLLVGSGHGTLPDGSGIRGIAPGATLRVYAIDDGTDPAKYECNRLAARLGQRELTSRAIHDAVDQGADVISMSFNMSGLTDAVRYAMSKGVVVVAAVGPLRDPITHKDTPGLLGLPAQTPGVVAVTASDRSGKPWPLAGTGGVTVAAPGVDISAGSMDADGDWSSQGLGTGTSPSTALVAGMVAVAAGRYPQATGAQLVQQLVRHTTRPGVHYDTRSGFGNASLTGMLESDPARNPDVLPFSCLRGDFLRDRVQADLDGTLPPLCPDPAGQPAAAAAATSGSPAPSSAAGPAGSVPAAQSTPARGSSHVVAGLVGGLAVLALLAVALLVVRRRSGRTSPVPVPGGLTS